MSDHEPPPSDLPQAEPQEHVDRSTPQPSSRFRFKTKRSRYEKTEDDRNGRRRNTGDDDIPHRHRKRHKSSRHKDGDQTSAFQHSTSRLPPDQAFRESLFDALGDDEGAAFWEGVYGQPIHNYPNIYQDDETGELEHMTDEEYAQFVRRKMWEKSWEGVEAAREEKRREREKEKKARRAKESRNSAPDQMPDDHDIFGAHIEASLRRGQRRKDRKRWHELWQEYLRRWDELRILAQDRQKMEADDKEQLFLRNKIAWPVESGRRKDIVREEIERFVQKGIATSESKEDESVALANAIKVERVRWHPDKIQQRYGSLEIDEGTLKGVTAVFQIFDAIWNDLRTRPNP